MKMNGNHLSSTLYTLLCSIAASPHVSSSTRSGQPLPLLPPYPPPFPLPLPSIYPFLLSVVSDSSMYEERDKRLKQYPLFK